MKEKEWREREKGRREGQEGDRQKENRTVCFNFQTIGSHHTNLWENGKIRNTPNEVYKTNLFNIAKKNPANPVTQREVTHTHRINERKEEK